MNVCIVTPSVIKGDGQGRANVEIVWEALRRGHRVTLVASRIAPELAAVVTWIPIVVNSFPSYLLREIIFAQRSNRWLQTHRHEFDLVQVYGAVTWATGDVNTAQFVHSGWLRSPVHISRVRRDVYGAYQWLYSVWNAYQEKKAFHRAQRVVAISQQVKQELLSIGVPETSIRVILNGVDPDEFFPAPMARSALGLPEQVPLALFAGDIRLNRKNLDTVLAALVEVPTVHLAVAGITQGSPYPQMAAQLGLGDRVHFLGLRSDVPQLMRAVDLFVFPSRYEPFGIVVLEAMATALPVITAPTTAAAEIMSPEAGVVLPHCDDVAALATALRDLLEDGDAARMKRQQMGLAARAIAQQHRWTSKAAQYVDLFEELRAVNSATPTDGKTR